MSGTSTDAAVLRYVVATEESGYMSFDFDSLLKDSVGDVRFYGDTDIGRFVDANLSALGSRLVTGVFTPQSGIEAIEVQRFRLLLVKRSLAVPTDEIVALVEGILIDAGYQLVRTFKAEHSATLSPPDEPRAEEDTSPATDREQS